ncbi:uncharacterized protein C8A04DRAFT_27857 [Dichotomopilus funicola]|uniref:Uncharacterized protein n=1 Tax=Dichotomopilus funicola TaxID=1934379 RepID=A0AAN6V4T1_9PEZI|nr:hypothetical protein C8A04DRAFT_27857 [Dichotomopilus funicola]
MAPRLWDAARLARDTNDSASNNPMPTIHPRQGKGSQQDVKLVLIVLGAIAAAIILYLLFRHFYKKYKGRGHKYQQASREDDHHTPNTQQVSRELQTSPQTNRQSTSGNADNNSGTNAAGVDRNTSVRSVMTLPVYRPKAAESEQVLGREGERDGIDIVVEMQTAEDEEALRDEEMEALYQIRAARRRQLADREARRRQRQEARDAHDTVALRDLRDRARASATRNAEEIEGLRGEHDRVRGQRQRAVSSVSYAEVGIARADGTRVRANSTESNDRVGLLSDTASIAAESLFHRRDRSASATLSIDTSITGPHRPESPGALSTAGASSAGNYPFGAPLSAQNSIHVPRARSRSRASSAATTTRIPTPNSITNGGLTPYAGSPPEIIEPFPDGDGDESAVDLGDSANMPPPPGYDEVSLVSAGGNGGSGGGGGDDSNSFMFTPLHSRRNSDALSRVSSVASRSVSPYPDPPPDYPGPGPAELRNNRLSAHMEELAAQAQTQTQTEEESRAGPSTNTTSATDTTAERTRGRPTLRLESVDQVPQIVIEPSSAKPGEQTTRF